MTVYWVNTKYQCLNFIIKQFGPNQTPLSILNLTKCELEEQEFRYVPLKFILKSNFGFQILVV